MVEEITYKLSDTKNNTVNINRLTMELDFVGLTPAYVLAKGTDIIIRYPDGFDVGAVKPNIDQIISYHDGSPIPIIEIMAEQTLRSEITEITLEGVWVNLGSVLLRPTKFHPDLPSLITQTVCEINASGCSGSIRMTEILPDGTVNVLTNPSPVFDTGNNNWLMVDVFSNVTLTDSFNKYTVDIKKSGSGVLMIKNITASLIRIM